MAERDALAALTSGNHRESLEMLRDVLAAHLLEADSNVAAQIAARLQSVLDAIAALPSAVTSSLMRWPRSSLTSLYVAPVAPEMVEQLAPAASHCIQRH